LHISTYQQQLFFKKILLARALSFSIHSFTHLPFGFVRFNIPRPARGDPAAAAAVHFNQLNRKSKSFAFKTTHHCRH
jgi:hypothetical protein